MDPNGQPVNHDGFHKPCFEQILNHRRFCPYDQQPIDPRFPVSRTERILAKLNLAFYNAAYSASFGMIIGAITAGVGAAGAIGAATGTAAAVVIGEVREIGAAVVAGVAAAAVSGGIVAGAGSGVVGAAIGATAGVATAAALGVIGIKTVRFLDRKGFDLTLLGNIEVGLYAAGTVAIAVTAGIPIATIATISLIGGAATAILSLVRT